MSANEGLAAGSPFQHLNVISLNQSLDSSFKHDNNNIQQFVNKNKHPLTQTPTHTHTSTHPQQHTSKSNYFIHMH
eukprot:m.93503 g.93503  ORF g.93503 m.93503 type:complete len:75 (-) comp12387_c0_seq2:36-260(-)